MGEERVQFSEYHTPLSAPWHPPLAPSRRTLVQRLILRVSLPKETDDDIENVFSRYIEGTLLNLRLLGSDYI